MLDEKRIRLLKERFDKKAKKYYDDYQTSGVAQTYAEYNRNRELADVCDRALSGASDHDEAMYWKGKFVEIACLAYDALHTCHLDDYKAVVHRITEINRLTRLVRNKWE